MSVNDHPHHSDEETSVPTEVEVTEQTHAPEPHHQAPQRRFRFPFAHLSKAASAKWKRETRFGLAVVLSFGILVAVMIMKKGDKEKGDKESPLLVQIPPPIKGEDPKKASSKDKPKAPAPGENVAAKRPASETESPPKDQAAQTAPREPLPTTSSEPSPEITQTSAESPGADTPELPPTDPAKLSEPTASNAQPNPTLASPGNEPNPSVATNESSTESVATPPVEVSAEKNDQPELPPLSKVPPTDSPTTSAEASNDAATPVPPKESAPITAGAATLLETPSTPEATPPGPAQTPSATPTDTAQTAAERAPASDVAAPPAGAEPTGPTASEPPIATPATEPTLPPEMAPAGEPVPSTSAPAPNAETAAPPSGVDTAGHGGPESPAPTPAAEPAPPASEPAPLPSVMPSAPTAGAAIPAAVAAATAPAVGGATALATAPAAESEQGKAQELPNLSPSPTESATPGSEEPKSSSTAVPTDLVPLPNAGQAHFSDEDQYSGTATRAIATTTPVERAVRTEATHDEPIESLRHVVKSGENYFTISRIYYNSGRYYMALCKANSDLTAEPEDLAVGMNIRIPPPEALDRSLILPPQVNRSADSNPRALVHKTSGLDSRKGQKTGNVRRSSEVDLALPTDDPFSVRRSKALPPADESEDPEGVNRPLHKVRRDETLRTIARDYLGKGQRASEIYELNRDVLDSPDARLVPGQVLSLPEDAGLSRRSR